jgi:hypothetical protein
MRKVKEALRLQFGLGLQQNRPQLSDPPGDRSSSLQKAAEAGQRTTQLPEMRGLHTALAAL